MPPTKDPNGQRPIRPTTYRNQVRLPKASSGRGPKMWGNHFCNEDVVTPMTLAWQDNKLRPSTTVARILPGRNFDEPTVFDAYRYRSLPNGQGLGDHIRTIYAWRRSGFPKITFAIYNPDEYPEGTRFETRQDPICTLYWATKRAAEGNADAEIVAAASRMLGGGDNRKAIIQRPTDIVLFRALVFEHGTVKDKDGRDTDAREFFVPPLGLGENEQVRLIEMNGFAGQKLISLMDQLKPDVSLEDVPHAVESDDEWAEFYTMPDPVSFDKGVMFYIYPADGLDPLAPVVSRNQPGRKASYADSARASQGQGGGKAESTAKGYAVVWRPDYTAPDGQVFDADLSEVADILKPKLVPWTPHPDRPDERSVLRCLSMEEKIRLVADSFRNPKRDASGRILTDAKGDFAYNLLLYAWQDFAEAIAMIPDELVKEGTGRAQMSRFGAKRYDEPKGTKVAETMPDGGEVPSRRQSAPAASTRRSIPQEDESLLRVDMPEVDDDDVIEDDDVVEEAPKKRATADAGPKRHSSVMDAVRRKKQQDEDEVIDVIDEDEFGDEEEEI